MGDVVIDLDAIKARCESAKYDAAKGLFVHVARYDAPALIAEVERLRALLVDQADHLDSIGMTGSENWRRARAIRKAVR